MSIISAIRDLNLCNEVNRESQLSGGDAFKRDVKAMLGLTPNVDIHSNREVLYRDFARQLVEKHGKPSRFKAVPMMGYSSSKADASLRDIKEFKRWLVKERQTYKKSHGTESARFATRCDGKGVWTGFTFLILSRTYMNSAFRIRHTHKRDIDVVLTDCNISCFFENRNLLQKGINWSWVMKHGALEAIRAHRL